jgi:hypothetical protein
VFCFNGKSEIFRAISESQMNYFTVGFQIFRAAIVMSAVLTWGEMLSVKFIDVLSVQNYSTFRTEKQAKQ